MQGGDISNEQVARLLIVWEHLLGLLPDKRTEAKVDRLLKHRRWEKACDLFEINEPLAHRIWDITWRYHYSIDVITWIGPEFAMTVADRVEREDLPIGRVRYENQTNFTRKLAYMPYVAAVYTPDPRHRFTFGGKGRVVSPQAAHRLVGAF